MSEFTIRPAIAADLPAINDIYNHYVGYCTCTYQETLESIESRQAWFAAHDERHPVIVAEAAGEVLAWGALSPFHERTAFRYTVEDSIYVRHDAQGRGLGSALLRELIDRATQLHHRSIIAVIDSGQRGSLLLHQRKGFVERGRIPQAGLKFGRWLEIVYLQLMLNSPIEIDPATVVTSCKI